ncbi:hypothetical protein JOD45_000122 [Scopulibacillus daqui]|uniref:PH (Pleckstrin Homology) domain-containing protein n=1 Tax=Scopulibacillus daqui TaxID=1469162 RepID=A0ABS2PVH1_9BACL|nr:hypothetical protein [Scopulibacillus daqui]MBM7643931.1 hypothetical protein [Scopulibacillus daqui]
MIELITFADRYQLVITKKKLTIINKEQQENDMSSYSLADIECLEIRKPFFIAKGYASIWLKSNKKFPIFTIFLSKKEYQTLILLQKFLLKWGNGIRIHAK